MSDAWPKALMPRSAATCIGAVVSVCWVRISTPWSTSALAASASLPGSNQVLAHTTLILKSGLIERAPMTKALMPITTSGIGKEAM
ncbi:hypothetical protein D3C72_1949170 [compost metagenome]